MTALDERAGRKERPRADGAFGREGEWAEHDDVHRESPLTKKRALWLALYELAPEPSGGGGAVCACSGS